MPKIAQFAEIHGIPSGSYEDWYDLAACTAPGVDPDWWFPERGASRERDRAKAICHSCPVKDQCCASAVAHEEQHGLFGGMSLPDRRKWRDTNERKTG